MKITDLMVRRWKKHDELSLDTTGSIDATFLPEIIKHN
jgi:hypothetical protein